MKDKFGGSPVTVSGVAWYRREQWALLKSVAKDAGELENSYDEWLEFAEPAFEAIRNTGTHLMKVDVDIEELIQWCKHEGRPVDGPARADFVTRKMKDND
ncbi:MAG: hypothetical protein K8S62_01665 [Candidatus Sabulitectum sp.]|nr:hypothetical protein [Candidatus Sabulitectum sp.]